jgi:hypothetical protein
MPEPKAGPGSPEGGTARGGNPDPERSRERSAGEGGRAGEHRETPARRGAPEPEQRELPLVSPGASPTRD